MPFRRVLSILLIFVWSLLANVSFGKTLCQHHTEHHEVEHVHAADHQEHVSGETQNHEGGEEQSQHCDCNTHRTHCCNCLNVFIKTNRLSIEHAINEAHFQIKLFNVKAEPILDGPFQPPRHS